MLRSLLVLALALEPVRFDGDPQVADLDVAREGVQVRLGEDADGWVVRVTDIGAQRVRLALTAPDGTVLLREVPLEAAEERARGRELAAAVSVIIEASGPDTPPPEPPPPPPDPDPDPTVESRHQPAGWVGVAARLTGGSPQSFDPAGGVGIGGGAWLADDRVMPLVEIGWERSASAPLRVDALRIAGGALVGGSVLRGHMWIGAGAMAGALGATARARGRATAWAGLVAIPLALQGRVSRFLFEAHAGPQFQFPPLRFRGDGQGLRWGTVRVLAGVRVGVTFGG